MSKKGVEINVAMNASEVQKGAKDVEESFEKVADSLDDVAKEADRAGRQMGDEIEDGAKDADRAVGRLERGFKEMADTAKRESQQAGSSMQRSMRDGADGAGEAVREWGDEAKQNISETFSSFRGEAEDLVGIVQDTFGGVISGLGPVGMAAGAAGALGIGLMMGAFEDAKEKEQEFREQVAELADQLIETGGEGAEAVQGIADRLRDIATETEKDAMSFDKLRAMAKDMGVDFADLAQAYVDGGGDLQSYITKLDERIAAEQRAYRESTKYTEGATIGTTAVGIKLEQQRAQLKGVADQYSEAEKAAQAWAESGGAALAARAEQMETLQGELDEAIGSWGDYYDAETGATDPAGYIAAMQARMDATANFNSNVQQLAEQFGLTFEETQAILDQGVDFAPVLQSIIDSGMGEQYAGQVRAMLDGGQAIVDGRPLNATVTTDADTGEAESKLDAATKKRDAPIEVLTDPKPAESKIDAAAAKKRTATIHVDADVTAANRKLAELTETRHTATVYVDMVERVTKKYDW